PIKSAPAARIFQLSHLATIHNQGSLRPPGRWKQDEPACGIGLTEWWDSDHPHHSRPVGRILIPPPPDAARRKGRQRLRCSMGRCSRRGSLKAAFRWWYQDAPRPVGGALFSLPAFRALAKV